jgi:hypothetical protein
MSSTSSSSRRSKSTTPKPRARTQAPSPQAKEKSSEGAKAQENEDGRWAALFSAELAPYRAPSAPLANAIFRWRLWFESTFVFTLLEPWEKGLLSAFLSLSHFLSRRWGAGCCCRCWVIGASGRG